MKRNLNKVIFLIIFCQLVFVASCSNLTSNQKPVPQNEQNTVREEVDQKKRETKSNSTLEPSIEATIKSTVIPTNEPKKVLTPTPAQSVTNPEKEINGKPVEVRMEEVYFTINKNFYGVNVKLNVQNSMGKNQAEIQQDIKGDFRTSVTINKLDVGNGTILADMDFSSWEYFKDQYNGKIIEIRNIDKGTNYYGLLDNMLNFQNNEKIDGKNILENTEKLKILSFLHYGTMSEIKSKFVFGKSCYITVPGKIMYATKGYKKIKENTIGYTNENPDYFSIIIFKPE